MNPCSLVESHNHALPSARSSWVCLSSPTLLAHSTCLRCTFCGRFHTGASAEPRHVSARQTTFTLILTLQGRCRHNRCLWRSRWICFSSKQKRQQQHTQLNNTPQAPPRRRRSAAPATPAWSALRRPWLRTRPRVSPLQPLPPPQQHQQRQHQQQQSRPLPPPSTHLPCYKPPSSNSHSKHMVSRAAWHQAPQRLRQTATTTFPHCRNSPPCSRSIHWQRASFRFCTL